MQQTEISLDDGVRTTFLYTRGTAQAGEENEELTWFLRYAENSTAEIAEASGSSFIRRIQGL